MNWLGVILLVIALIMVFIVAIILSTTLKQTPGSSLYNNTNTAYSYGGLITPFAGTLTVESGKIVSATVLSWITVVVLIIAIFAVAARTTVNNTLQRFTVRT